MEKETKLKPGAVLVMQNDSQVWRRCRVIEGAGLMSKKVKIHYIGYQTKWDGKRNCCPLVSRALEVHTCIMD